MNLIELFKITPYDDSKHDTDRVIFEDAERYGQRQNLRQERYVETFLRMRQKYNIITALDLGCGLGNETVALLESGINTIGIDGAKTLLEGSHIAADRYVSLDLRNNFKFQKFGVDMIHCREVAEHIPFKYSELLIRNIIRNCRVCYFTAAPPGQIGSGHINCQKQAFWASLFEKYKWEVDWECTMYNRINHSNHLDRDNAIIVFGEMQPMLRM